MCGSFSCCKPKKLKSKHDTINTSIIEAKKIFDVHNICNFSKEVIMMNNLICEHGQKKIIDYLIRPTITVNEEITKNNDEECEIDIGLFDVRKRKKMMMKRKIMNKANLQDALMLMRNEHDSNGINDKLINSISISSNAKTLLFSQRESNKNEAQIMKYFKYIRDYNKTNGGGTTRRYDFSEVKKFIIFYSVIPYSIP